jgi:hypothetical protein
MLSVGFFFADDLRDSAENFTGKPFAFVESPVGAGPLDDFRKATGKIPFPDEQDDTPSFARLDIGDSLLRS